MPWAFTISNIYGSIGFRRVIYALAPPTHSHFTRVPKNAGGHKTSKIDFIGKSPKLFFTIDMSILLTNFHHILGIEVVHYQATCGVQGQSEKKDQVEDRLKGSYFFNVFHHGEFDED